MGCMTCKASPLGTGGAVHPTGRVDPMEAWLCDVVDDYDSYQLNNAIMASRNYNSRASVQTFEPPPPYSERAGALERVVEDQDSDPLEQEQRLHQTFDTSDFLNQSHSSSLSLPMDLHERIATLEIILQRERASARAAGAIEPAATTVRVVPHRLDVPPSVQQPPVRSLPPLPPCPPPPLVPRSLSQDSFDVDLPPISLHRSFSQSQHHHIQRRRRRKSQNRRRSQTASQSLRNDSDRQITIRRHSTSELMNRREEEERGVRVEGGEREGTAEEEERKETVEEQEKEKAAEEGKREENIEDDHDDDQVDNVTESDEGRATIDQSTNNQNENERERTIESSKEEEETEHTESSEEHNRNFSYQFELHRKSRSLNCIVKSERENECKSNSYCIMRTTGTV
ncbi:PREDICTED: uncharacterized protein DDB_G0284459-like [Amphimedon queenslandica]|uniref:Uncharacterized protein n=1 Tax=Amphimedon queenslandica TaxID=400682 RepID=A0A1X7VIP9_AMPQE|nr:PREDICTED: uncharacterized protein DDB_G0284459-like [Amphimedon queenslandica]|eukprot:XP_019848651.1 PREDICTED: uncharacterized protein DDB_G0284459-like [Amphimedon queenslandica]